jgi:hypothetical protein
VRGQPELKHSRGIAAPPRLITLVVKVGWVRSGTFALKKAKSGRKLGQAISMNPSELIDKQIADLKDWRGRTFANLREIVHQADPKIVEEWKWSTAVWSHDGLVVAVGAFKDKLKVNFFQGASLPDPKKLFNAGLESKKSRGIDLKEGDKIDEPALKALVRAAVAHNSS